MQGTRRASRWFAIAGVCGLAVSFAAAQTVWIGNAPGNPNDWFTPANWTAGVPNATTDAVLNHAGVAPVAQIRGGDAATRQLTIATTGIAQVNVEDGRTLMVHGPLMVGRDAGSAGYLILDFPRGHVDTRAAATIGDEGRGDVYLRDTSTWSAAGEVVIGNSGVGSWGWVGLENAARFGGERVIVGNRDGTRGNLILSGTSRASIRELFVGVSSVGPHQTRGEVDLFGHSLLEISGAGFVGAQPGQGASRASLVLHGTNAAIKDDSPDGNAVLTARGSQARIYGQGRYDIRVVYESDRNLGTFNNQPVSVAFARDSLQVGAAHNIVPGLTQANVGQGQIVPNEKVQTLTAQALPNTVFNVSWSAGAPTFANDVTYQIPGGNKPQVSVPFNPADVSGGGGVSVSRVLPRVSLLQFGATLRTGNAQSPAGDYPGLVRNITSNVDSINGVVTGTTNDVQGNFDVAVMGKAVTPQHQIPAIRTLHNVYGLRGQGVRFGQIEPDTPYLQHGAFDDWTTAGGLRASVQGAMRNDAHATRVASIMIGYDPLGVHVNGQSQFEFAANRINNGFGFTGVAPLGTLVSTGDNGGTGMRTLVGLATPPVVINQSAGGGAANGNTIDARMIDHYIAANRVIFTKSAGNRGDAGGGVTQYTSLTDPAGAYNAIVVGNAQFDDPSYPTNFGIGAASIRPSSSRGPTADGRSAPHLVAQGTGNYTAYIMERYTNDGGTTRSEIDPAFPIEGNRRLYSTQDRSHDPRGTAVAANAVDPNSGTSYAAPTVAGVAGLMWERGARFGNATIRGHARDPRTIKSILMTSADKPAAWTRGQPGVTGANDTTVPLSYDWGAGLLSPVNAMDLLDRGFKASGLTNTHTGKGWGFDRVDAGMTSRIAGADVQGIFYVLQTPQNGTPFTATLNWYRHVSGAGGANPYNPSPLADLDLELYTWDRANAFVRIARSNSTLDNHEHIFMRTTPNLADGWVWVLRVLSTGVAAGSPETFAVSWAYMAVPGPGALAILAAAGLAALGRRRR
jgi:hypothetical protein